MREMSIPYSYAPRPKTSPQARKPLKPDAEMAFGEISGLVIFEVCHILSSDSKKPLDLKGR